MAIHVMNPNTIGNQTQAMFNVTSNSGRKMIGDLSSIIYSLKSHWKGSDAVANLRDLGNVYTATTDFVKEMQKIIVAVNNDEVLPLQQHIISSGGQCAKGSELAVSLNVDSYIDVTTDSVESWTDPAIITDAETFSTFPSTFQKFVNELNETYKELTNNWIEGSNRNEVENLFGKFNEKANELYGILTTVSKNLNIVAENKKQLL